MLPRAMLRVRWAPLLLLAAASSALVLWHTGTGLSDWVQELLLSQAAAVPAVWQPPDTYTRANNGSKIAPEPEPDPEPEPEPEPEPYPRWEEDRNDWWSEQGLNLMHGKNGLKQHIDIFIAILSGRASKYAARRLTARESWIPDLIRAGKNRGMIIRYIFVIGDNYCGYAPSEVPQKSRRFPSSGSCRTANEHIQGGALSDEHEALLTEYRRFKDLFFVPKVLDSYYSSASKLRSFYRCVEASQLDFEVLIKMDDDGLILREKFLDSYQYLAAELTKSWPRWWGHFNEWAPAWRAPDEAEEVAARVSRSTHAWTVTRQEWPYRYFPSFAVGTAHALNRATIDCFGRLHDLDTTMNASVPTGHLRDHATRVNTSVWMEDVAHAVWFDRCVAQGPSRTGRTRSERAHQRGCRIFDQRFSKASTTSECRADAITIGSVDSAPAIKHLTKAGGRGECGCLSGKLACAIGATKDSVAKPTVRCGDTDEILSRDSANSNRTR